MNEFPIHFRNLCAVSSSFFSNFYGQYPFCFTNYPPVQSNLHTVCKFVVKMLVCFLLRPSSLRKYKVLRLARISRFYRFRGLLNLAKRDGLKGQRLDFYKGFIEIGPITDAQS